MLAWVELDAAVQPGGDNTIVMAHLFQQTKMHNSDHLRVPRAAVLHPFSELRIHK